MNKIEALNYLENNRKDYDEWSGAGMSYIFGDIIKSNKNEFTKEELDILLEKAYNN